MQCGAGSRENTPVLLRLLCLPVTGRQNDLAVRVRCFGQCLSVHRAGVRPFPRVPGKFLTRRNYKSPDRIQRRVTTRSFAVPRWTVFEKVCFQRCDSTILSTATSTLEDIFFEVGSADAATSERIEGRAVGCADSSADSASLFQSGVNEAAQVWISCARLHTAGMSCAERVSSPAGHLVRLLHDGSRNLFRGRSGAEAAREPLPKPAPRGGTGLAATTLAAAKFFSIFTAQTRRCAHLVWNFAYAAGECCFAEIRGIRLKSSLLSCIACLLVHIKASMTRPGIRLFESRLACIIRNRMQKPYLRVNTTFMLLWIRGFTALP